MNKAGMTMVTIEMTPMRMNVFSVPMPPIQLVSANLTTIARPLRIKTTEIRASLRI